MRQKANDIVENEATNYYKRMSNNEEVNTVTIIIERTFIVQLPESFQVAYFWLEFTIN